MNEIFRDVVGYEGIYQISNLGRVKILRKKRVDTPKYLKSIIRKTGYCYVNLFKDGNRKQYAIHQLVAIAFLNHKRQGHKIVVDHINHNKSDNRLCNLRVVTHRENISHRKTKSKSKYTGVYWLKKEKKWRSYIGIDGKMKYLGRFNCELDAHKAYQSALKELHH